MHCAEKCKLWIPSPIIHHTSQIRPYRKISIRLLMTLVGVFFAIVTGNRVHRWRLIFCLLYPTRRSWWHDDACRSRDLRIFSSRTLLLSTTKGQRAWIEFVPDNKTMFNGIAIASG